MPEDGALPTGKVSLKIFNVKALDEIRRLLRENNPDQNSERTLRRRTRGVVSGSRRGGPILSKNNWLSVEFVLRYGTQRSAYIQLSTVHNCGRFAGAAPNAQTTAYFSENVARRQSRTVYNPICCVRVVIPGKVDYKSM